MQETVITVDTPAALVMRLGSVEVSSSGWWMRRRAGIQGLEATLPGGDRVRLELSEPAPEPDYYADAAE